MSGIALDALNKILGYVSGLSISFKMVGSDIIDVVVYVAVYVDVVVIFQWYVKVWTY